MTPDRLAEISARAYRHMSPWSAASFADTLASTVSVLSTSEHAFVVGHVIADEAEILALAADPDHQRTGQATRALQRFENDARKRGACTIFLDVARANAPARAFYERLGYEECGRRKAYYKRSGGTADDAIVMRKILA